MLTHEHGERKAELQILSGLRLALVLAGVALVIEAAGALFARSLAMTVDAAHNVPDLIAFAASWSALAATRRGTSAEQTFGAHRLEVFAGLANGLLVLGTGVAFGYEALGSLLERSSFAGPVDPYWILVAAVPTLALRLLSLRALGKVPGRVRDLNLYSAIIHVVSDLATTFVLLLAAVTLVLRPSLVWIDAAGALAISGILAYESYPILREGYRVLAERVPPGLSVAAIRSSAKKVTGVIELHDVHVWSVCSTLVYLTAHVEVSDMSVRECMDVVEQLRSRMEEEFGIVHATFETETLPRGDRPHGHPA